MKKTIQNYLLALMLLFLTPSLALASNPNTKLAIERSSNKITIHLLGIICDFCARSLEKVFKKQPEVKKISVDLDKAEMQIYLNANQDISNENLEKLIQDAGYQIDSIK